MLGFEQLQKKLNKYSLQEEPGSFTSTRSRTVVAIPSIPFIDIYKQQKSFSRQPYHYEERFFYLINLLRDPHLRLILVFSHEIEEEVISYYLHLLPKVPYHHARSRLTIISVGDLRPFALTQKILERSALCERIRYKLKDSESAFLITYHSGRFEQELAQRLQLPLLGPTYLQRRWENKSQAREIFARSGLSLLPGKENIENLRDLFGSAQAFAEQYPDQERAMAKTNWTIGGWGCAYVDLNALRHLEESQPYEAWLEPAYSRRDLEDWCEAFDREGGVLERYLAGDVVSVQLSLLPGLEPSAEIVSTHHEVFHKVEKTEYAGCSFPASAYLRRGLHHYGYIFSRFLERERFIGRLDIDFLVEERADSGQINLYAIDLNVRRGNTTSPLRTVELLTDAHYDLDQGKLVKGGNFERCYVSDDDFGLGMFAGCSAKDVLAMAAYGGLHYNQGEHCGLIFQMLSGVSESGSVGVVSVARTKREAREQLERAKKRFEELLTQSDWLDSELVYQ